MKKDVMQRFEKFVDPVTESGCFLWTGCTLYGYGLFQVNNKAIRAHRFAWEQKYGRIENGLHVLHRCDVRACVNVDHLFLGTNSDNMEDRKRKGRNKLFSGPNHGSAKLSWDQIKEIRNSKGTHVEIAKRFPVSDSAIGYIRRNVYYKFTPTDKESEK